MVQGVADGELELAGIDAGIRLHHPQIRAEESSDTRRSKPAKMSIPRIHGATATKSRSIRTVGYIWARNDNPKTSWTTA